MKSKDRIIKGWIKRYNYKRKWDFILVVITSSI